MGHTFLNSYKSVWLLNDHNPGTLFGKSNCSLGLQYSTKPPSSAEMTQSNLSLYYLEVSDHDCRSHYKNEGGSEGTHGHQMDWEPMELLHRLQWFTIPTTIVKPDGTRIVF